jgi:hypothetical protein
MVVSHIHYNIQCFLTLCEKLNAYGMIRSGLNETKCFWLVKKVKWDKCRLYTNFRSAHSKKVSSLHFSYSCSAHPFKKYPFFMLHCTKKSHRLLWDPQCNCKFCVKNGPASLKSQCVNKLLLQRLMGLKKLPEP